MVFPFFLFDLSSSQIKTAMRYDFRILNANCLFDIFITPLIKSSTYKNFRKFQAGRLEITRVV